MHTLLCRQSRLFRKHWPDANTKNTRSKQTENDIKYNTSISDSQVHILSFEWDCTHWIVYASSSQEEQEGRHDFNTAKGTGEKNTQTNPNTSVGYEQRFIASLTKTH